MSVTRAARTRYSTRYGSTSQGSATVALDRVRARRTGARDPLIGGERWVARDARGGCDRPVLHSGRLPLIYGIASAATCAPPGCGSLSAVTRDAHQGPGTAAQGRADGDRTVSSRVTTRVQAPDRARWFRPVSWRRLNETAQGKCARGRQHPGVRGVQLERQLCRPERCGERRGPSAAASARRRALRRVSRRRASSSSASRCPSRGRRRPTASRPSRARSSRPTRPTRPVASVATPSRSSRSIMPSTASTTSSRALRTCTTFIATRRSSASSDRTTRPSRRSRSRSATRLACSSAARPIPTRR